MPLIPYTEHEIYILLDNANCIEDLQHIGEWLNENKDCFTPQSHAGFIRLMKVLYKFVFMTPEQKKRNIATWRNKFPEKYKAIAACRNLPRTKGFELHHWSYNIEHWKDVIHLSIKSHNLAHRFIIYDQERRMYRIAATGELLDTKERHIGFISGLKA